MGTLIAVVVLLAANGFFVAAEFALVKAQGVRLDTLASEGRPGARLVVRIQRQLEAYLAACQLGITMASLGLGWVGEPAVAAVLEPLFRRLGLSDAMLHGSAFVVGFLVFSSLHIVVGEQVPKTFAIRKPEPVSLWVAYPLHGFYLVMYPLNHALNRASNAILGLFGVTEATHADVFTDDELRGLISTSRQHGGIEEGKARMLSNLFAFDERTVGRVMVPRGDVTVLDLSAPPDDNLRRLRETQHSRFPVVDAEDRPVGVVLAKRIYAEVLDGDTSPWARLAELSAGPLIVPETLRVAELFETMRTERAHMALVVDEYGEFVGLVTLEDLLEEIVGDIVDETDAPEPRYPIRSVQGGWEAHGLAPLGDVQRATDLAVPPELDANTLSGLFMQRLGRMPERGDVIEESGYRLEVKAMRDHRVESVHIARVPPRSADAATAESAGD